MSLVELMLKAVDKHKSDMGNEKLKRRAAKLCEDVKLAAEVFLAPRKCERCGNCCRTFSLGLSEKDLEREPRLKQYAVPANTLPKDVAQMVCIDRLGEVWAIAKKSDKLPDGYDQCPFLVEEGPHKFTCGIRDTRPHTCRKFKTSGFRCHEAGLKVEFPDIDFGKTIEAWKAYGTPPEVAVCKLMDITAEGLRSGKNMIFGSEEELHDYMKTAEQKEGNDG